MIAFIKSLKRGDLHGWRVLKKERMSKCKTTIKKQCHSERSEESRVHKVGVTEILRYALDDKMIGNFYYDTPLRKIYHSFTHF